MSYMPTPLTTKRKRLADMTKEEYAEYEQEREKRYQIELITKIITGNNITSFDKRDFESLLQSSKEFKLLYEELSAQSPIIQLNNSSQQSQQSQRSDFTPVLQPQQIVSCIAQTPNSELTRLRTENQQLKTLLQQEQQRRQQAENERDELLKKVPRTVTPQVALQAAKSVLQKYADLDEQPKSSNSSHASNASRNIFSQQNQFVENDEDLDNNAFDSQFLEGMTNDYMSTKEMNAPPAKIPQELFDLFE
ncbi:hypothetical protein SS50377_24457 [Spironucleus salmonicida]|uniref:Uncharacterized protein n=1 Tax=Spironucleus salmonicida TaxID=348837 RepID=V6LMZ1_9EUKA|nr:hypothetical protein SS50377_24457 [Spironucleus salmonicida]|eukprot:EST45995.1 Hypothetical protein SS50377_13977 [Spironucleus salmonicida]